MTDTPQPCPWTNELPCIYERADVDAFADLVPHIRSCPTCQAEVKRLNDLYREPSGAAELLGDFLRGVAFLAGLGFVLGMNASFKAIIMDKTRGK